MASRRRASNRSRNGAIVPVPYRLLILVMTLLLVAAACSFDDPEEEGGDGGDGAAEEPAEGDTTFDIAIGIEPDTLDPIGQTTTTVQNIVDYSVETLTTIDADGALQPGLATAWEVSEDGLTVTLELQEGVEFHDGAPFDAEAVAWNIDRVLDEALTVPQRDGFTPIDSTEVLDEHTIQLNLSVPSPAMPSALSQTTGGMLSPESVEAEGNSYETVVHPVGTGPYTFDSYEQGDRVTVTKFDGYWGEEPYYETVNIRIVPEAATRESDLRSGQVDMIILPPISDIPDLEADESLEVIQAASDRSIFIALNTNVLDDVRVRQALNYAVNKEEMISELLFGSATALNSPISEPLFGYCEAGTYDYDPDRARELLEEAGVTELTLTMGHPVGRYNQDQEVAQAIAGYLADVGVTANLQTSDWAAYVDTITAPPEDQQFDAHLLGWAPSFLDAQQQMVQFAAPNHPPAGLATSFYTNAEVETLLQSAASEVDEDARADQYCQAAEIVWDEAPWIYLWTQTFPIVHSADVTGIGSLPIEKFDAIYARPAE